MATKFYTLHNAAGLIRTNKFNDKKDAICIGTFRAEFLNLPIKIYEHDGEGNQECVLVCNLDGSVEKPQALGREMNDLGNAAGVDNRKQANLLLAAFDEQPITTFRLKGNSISETQFNELEKSTGCDIGMVSSESFNAFTQEPKVIHQIETKLSEWGLELDDILETELKRNKTHAALEATEPSASVEGEVVTSARKAQLAARSKRLPEFRCRAASKFGGRHTLIAHCEMGPEDKEGKKSPKIHVHVNGSKVGEVTDERQASRLIAEHAEKEYSKYLRKELG